MTRHLVRSLLALAAAAVACTGGDPAAPDGNGPNADFVAAALSRTADSLVQAGNGTAAIPFADAGSTLATLGRGGIVRVTEGGVTSEYQAVAQRYLLPALSCAPPDSSPPAPPAPPVGCLLATRPVLLLWKGTTPDEVIEVRAAPGVSRVGESWLGLLAGGPAPGPTGSVLWERAARRAWVAFEGSVTIGEATLGDPCPRAPRLPEGLAGTCTQGTQRAAFDLTYRRVDSLRSVAITRRLVLEASTVPLVEIRLTNAGPPLPPRPDTGVRPPPVVPAPPSFPLPTLAGRVDARRQGGVVKMALTITNTTPDSVVVLFASGQEYDFQVRAGIDTLWTWSSLATFVAVPHSRTWAPFETRTFTAEWSGPGIPAAPLVVVGRLTSSNRPLVLFGPVIAAP